jgi:WD40 repeat protein
MRPEESEGTHAIRAVPQPVSYSALWQLAPNTVTRYRGLEGCGWGAFAMSADAARFVCESFGLTWADTRKNRARFVDLAPDWTPAAPRSGPADDLNYHSTPSYVPYPYAVLSLRLGSGASDVYVTYRRTDAGEGWRLERWTPESFPGEAPPWGHGSVTRLASADRGRARLLALSPDGRLLVLADDGAALTVRRAPGYEPERLAADGMTAATAAVLSPDGERIVTGHADGRLRLWDVRSGRPLAMVSP